MRNGGPAEDWKIVPLAPEATTVFDARESRGISLANPSIEALPGGGIVVSVDQYGPGVPKLPGKKGKNPHFKHRLQGKIFTSSDQGQTWTFREGYPFANGRLFRDGHYLYLIGDAGSVQIIRSADGGTSWTAPEDLTAREMDGDCYVQSPTEVLRANGRIYLVAMKITDYRHRGSLGSTHAAVVMRATEGANLLNPKSWEFSSPVTAFRDLIPQDAGNYMGIPFFRVPRPDRAETIAHQRWADRMGWYAAHIVQIKDPNHYWYDPSGKTFHILASAATHRSNFAVLAKVHEDESGKMVFGLETTPSGAYAAFLPMPGGNRKFHLLYDETSELYWLVSNQMRDSMTKAKKLPQGRQDLPCDEDQRLQLHFSGNLVDWCFAGYVDAGTRPGQFRYGCSMAVRANDLCIASLAGETGHQAPRVVLYTIPDFRSLIY